MATTNEHEGPTSGNARVAPLDRLERIQVNNDGQRSISGPTPSVPAIVHSRQKKTREDNLSSIRFLSATILGINGSRSLDYAVFVLLIHYLLKGAA